MGILDLCFCFVVRSSLSLGRGRLGRPRSAGVGSPVCGPLPVGRGRPGRLLPPWPSLWGCPSGVLLVGGPSLPPGVASPGALGLGVSIGMIIDRSDSNWRDKLDALAAQGKRFAIFANNSALYQH